MGPYHVPTPHDLAYDQSPSIYKDIMHCRLSCICMVFFSLDRRAEACWHYPASSLSLLDSSSSVIFTRRVQQTPFILTQPLPNMPAPKDRKFYLRAPDLEFRLNGPIKIGNVITDMTLPQDPITFFDPLPKIIPGAGYSKGKTEREHHASLNAGLSAKLYDVFGGQAEAKTSSSLKTIYAFDKAAAWYLERNPTAADAKRFREKDEEFKSALRNGPVSTLSRYMYPYTRSSLHGEPYRILGNPKERELQHFGRR
ncbi:hypothetical protein BU16DRAFT_377726 [Lophium mytilinum]|uniref:Uncharacterized protein n=1 Tax=Lophium mytilinum TaxID=390894 RepID=A0A6A6QW44_9PEZI|nr:hypothetical protein BU16DRAFT_377726 [Lophium mytilinum]